MQGSHCSAELELPDLMGFFKWYLEFQMLILVCSEPWPSGCFSDSFELILSLSRALGVVVPPSLL